MKSTESVGAERVWQTALQLLAGRDYTTARMRIKLSSPHISEDDVEAVLLRLQAEGWINDRRYALRFAESALSSGRYFGSRLKLEMRRRGIPAELIDESLKSASEDHDETEEIRSILDNRYAGFVFSKAGAREKQRIVGWLQRRGFCISAIMKVLRETSHSGGADQS